MGGAGKSRLILFDIDGTLITSGGAGEGALRLAVRERFGRDDDLSGIEIAGRTDKLIMREIFALYGIEETPENVGALFDSYVFHLEHQLRERKGRLLPGILPLLDALRARPEVVLALLTGNIERGAKLKLSHYGVAHYFEFGAYADDHHDRNELGRFAQARALKLYGVKFSPEQICILGDTPHDISCARAIGAKAVAIATGTYSAVELAKHQPDYLFEDLSDLDRVLEVLL